MNVLWVLMFKKKMQQFNLSYFVANVAYTVISSRARLVGDEHCEQEIYGTFRCGLRVIPDVIEKLITVCFPRISNIVHSIAATLGV